jgi:hypothetical protein
MKLRFCPEALGGGSRMPDWAYDQPALRLAVLMVVGLELLSMLGLFFVRRFLQPSLRFSDGVHDAISGTVQAIGVFYGITVGLIAVGVWNTHTSAKDVVSREAAALGALYRDVSGYSEPQRTEMRGKLRDYTQALIRDVWPEQRHGRISDAGTRIMNDFQRTLFAFEPATPGQTALHSEALQQYNRLIEYRRLRIDSVHGGLSAVMWGVIWIGAIISIGVAYLYRIDDPKLHAILVGLMTGFLGVLLFMIVINDRPFIGPNGITPDSYQVILDRLIDLPPSTTPSD